MQPSRASAPREKSERGTGVYGASWSDWIVRRVSPGTSAHREVFFETNVNYATGSAISYPDRVRRSYRENVARVSRSDRASRGSRLEQKWSVPFYTRIIVTMHLKQTVVLLVCWHGFFGMKYQSLRDVLDQSDFRPYLKVLNDECDKSNELFVASTGPEARQLGLSS